MRELKYRLRVANKIVGYEMWIVPQGEMGKWAYSYKNTAFNLGITSIPHTEKDQFTGLLNKWGVEIYEGDIIQFVVPDCTWSNPQAVMFCHGSFVTKSGNLYGLGFAPDIVHNDKLKYLEVIGNIHEDKELPNDLSNK